MGTDIHGRIQCRYREDGAYEDVGEIDRERNYVVFAMLAGVRNGYGFAGVETHVPLTPISEPRGLPADLGLKGRDWSEFDNEKIAEPKVRHVPYDDFDFGDHSFSWVTLREVLDWPGWNASLQRVGILDRAEYERVQREGGVPNEWCGGVSGPGIVIVDAADANGTGGYTHVRYHWEQPFADTCQTFRKWIEYLESKYGWLLERDPAAIRLVFGFDS